MSTVSEDYPLSARAKAAGPRRRTVHPRPSHGAAAGSRTWSVMGPANRALGLPLMGAADAGLHPYLMGGPDPDGQIR
jgi:hypothetical protein